MLSYHTIALLTDFGLADAYVGAMKGVICSIAPRVRVIDISHDLPPQNVQAAAYVLWSAYKYFPRKTIFVAVLDPGVGTNRPLVCVKTKNYLFLAPDNGLLKFVLADLKTYTAFAVTNTRLWLPKVSSSFHGRDIFVPVSARLASGVPPSQVGKRIRLITQAEPFVTVNGDRRGLHKGRVVHVDRFGNLITNLRLDRVPKGHFSRDIRIRVGAISRRQKRESIIQRFHRTYGDAPMHEPFVMIGSSGLLEIAVKEGSAAAMLDANAEIAITLETSYDVK